MTGDALDMIVALAYALMCIIWGSTWMVIKIGLRGAPPMTAVAVRYIIAAGIIYAILSLRRIAIPRTRAFALLGLFLGIMHFAVPYTLVYWGEQRISSGLTAVLYATLPFVTAILARRILGDALGWRKILGIVLGVAGVAFIFADAIQIGGREAAAGVFAVLGSVLFAAVSSIVVKRYGGAYDPLASLLIPFTVAGLVVTAGAVPVERSNPVTYDAVTWSTIVYLALFGSVVAFTLYFWIIKRMDVTSLSYMTFIIPIIAVLMGRAFLGETLSVRVAVGSAFVLVGILLARQRRKVVSKHVPERHVAGG